MNNWHILTECYVDTLLAEIVSPPKKAYNHQLCCTKVLKTMKEKFPDNAALGIIDDDKSAPKDFMDFFLLKKHNEQLAIYKHTGKPHYVIKIGKAVEDFILKNAIKCCIQLSDYNLPSDLEGLKRRTKHTTSRNDTDLKRLFLALKQNDISDFGKLTQWLELFKATPYHIITDQL